MENVEHKVADDGFAYTFDEFKRYYSHEDYGARWRMATLVMEYAHGGLAAGAPPGLMQELPNIPEAQVSQPDGAFQPGVP